MAEKVTQNDLMKKIQELDFAKVECELYLDTHPNDAVALSYYNALLPELDALMIEYQDTYGPIVPSKSNKASWDWVMGMWPWQMGMEDN